jgi:hypothetical protein
MTRLRRKHPWAVDRYSDGWEEHTCLQCGALFGARRSPELRKQLRAHAKTCKRKATK